MSGGKGLAQNKKTCIACARPLLIGIAGAAWDAVPWLRSRTKGKLGQHFA